MLIRANGKAAVLAGRAGRVQMCELVVPHLFFRAYERKDTSLAD